MAFLSTADATAQLFKAATEGSATLARSLLERKDVDVNSLDNKKNPPLVYAAENGRVAVVKLLLEWEGVQPNLEGCCGCTPLLCAASEGHKDVVEVLLLRDGIDADKADASGKTPLSYAAIFGRRDIVELLLNWKDVNGKGVNVDSVDIFGRTPLSHASESGHREVVKQLIDKKADARSWDYQGRTPAWYAAVMPTWNPPPTLVQYTAVEREEIVKLLVGQGGRKPLILPPKPPDHATELKEYNQAMRVLSRYSSKYGQEDLTM